MAQLFVQDTIYRLAHNRLSTIQYVHEILVMYEGNIVERGNHTNLMAKNGTYHKLVGMQQF